MSVTSYTSLSQLPCPVSPDRPYCPIWCFALHGMSDSFLSWCFSNVLICATLSLAGSLALQQTGLNLIKLMLSKAALPRDKTKTPTRADLAASQKKVSLVCSASLSMLHKTGVTAQTELFQQGSPVDLVAACQGSVAQDPGSKLLYALLKHVVNAMQLLQELGPSLMYQAVSRFLLKIAAFFLDNGVDVTDCFPCLDKDRVASPLLLLIEASQVPALV